MKIVTYNEACDLVKEIKNGKRKTVLCIVVASKNCPFCFELKSNIYPKVKEKYEDDIEFVQFIQPDLLIEDDNFIFPIIKVGPAPLEGVLQDVGEMIKFNRKYND